VGVSLPSPGGGAGPVSETLLSGIWNSGQRTESGSPVILSIIHHRWKPSDYVVVIIIIIIIIIIQLNCNEFLPGGSGTTIRQHINTHTYGTR
jgi:hypothetical protein